MEPNDAPAIAGYVLIAAGLIDPLVMHFLIAPKIPNPGTRGMVWIAIASGSAILIGLGVAFITGAFGA